MATQRYRTVYMVHFVCKIPLTTHLLPFLSISFEFIALLLELCLDQIISLMMNTEQLKRSAEADED